MSGRTGVAPDAPAGADVPSGVEVVELSTAPALGSLYRSAVAGALRPSARRRDVATGQATRSATGRTTVPVTGDRTPTRPTPRSLPAVAYAVHGLQADPDRLTAYQHLVGEPGTDRLPAGFVHVLTFPLAMALMVRDDFPLRVLGLIHVANRVEQRAPLRLGQPLDARAWAADLRPHHAGTQVDLISEVRSDGAVAWRGVSTYLAKGVRLTTATGERPAAKHGRPPFVAPVPTGSWRLAADTGRIYAAVSGDVNPIHLWAPAARAFGFRGAIAHGMYTAARALAMVGPAHGDSFAWSVELAAPVVLPTTVAVRVARDETGTGHSLTVWDPRRVRPHLTGTVTPLE